MHGPAPIGRLSEIIAGDLSGYLYPTTSEAEKISLTGHRIRYLKVDANTGEEVPSEEIIKG